MKIHVLAAGYATRMYPLTRDQPKALLEVAGQPILTRILFRLIRLPDVSEIVLVSNARFAARFRAWAEEFSAGERKSPPVRVLDDGSTQESERLGAVGDLAFALREAPPAGEDFVVVAGDNLIDFDPTPAWRTFRHARRPLLLVRRVEQPGELSRYNEVTLDAAATVLRLREKPRDPQGTLAAIALYFFTPQVEPLLARYLASGGNRDAPGHFVSWLVEQIPVGASPFEGRWFDVGSLETLAAARESYGEPAATRSPAGGS